MAYLALNDDNELNVPSDYEGEAVPYEPQDEGLIDECGVIRAATGECCEKAFQHEGRHVSNGTEWTDEEGI